jgi:hypothetical protein
MKNSQKITILFLSIIIVTLSTPAYAQTATVGLSKGNIFTYDYSVTWTSTDPYQTMPSEVTRLNSIRSIKINITDISETTINTETTTYYKDGTEQKETGFVDVSSGNIRMDFGFLIVRSGMNPNEKIYPTGGDAKINELVQRTYPTGQRETMHKLEETTSNGYYEKTEFFFDRALGLAVSYTYESRETSGDYTTTITETLTNTNSDVWAVAQASNSPASPTPTVPEFPLMAVPLLFAAASAVLLFGKSVKKLPLKL